MTDVGLTAFAADAPPPASQPDPTALLRAMAAGSSTSRWDIVCSYGLEQLNQILAARYANNQLVSRVQFGEDNDDELRPDLKRIDYDIALGAPTMRFTAGRAGSVALTMPIVGGSYTATMTDRQVRVNVPEGKYSLVAVVPLAAVTGEVKEAKPAAGAGEVKEAQPPTGAGEVITFQPGAALQSSIVLHFKAAGVDGEAWRIEPAPEQHDKAMMLTYVQPALQRHFMYEVDHLDYRLTDLLSDQAAPPTGEKIIEPRSFVFAAAGDEREGVLSLYIQTTSSESPGNANPSFQSSTGDVATLVPPGFGASLVLSRTYVEECYLVAQLKALGFTHVSAYPADQPGILRVSGAYPTTLTFDKGLVFLPVAVVDFEPYKVDFAHQPFMFTFTTDTLRVTMETHGKVDWKTSPITPEAPWPPPMSGTASVTIKLDHSYPLNGISTVSDQGLGLFFSIDHHDFTVTVDPGVENSCWNDDLGDKLHAQIAARVSKAFPQITLDLPGLNYFRATNLLFPGGHVITFDRRQGIHVPHDLVLFGSLTAPTA